SKRGAHPASSYRSADAPCQRKEPRDKAIKYALCALGNFAGIASAAPAHSFCGTKYRHVMTHLRAMIARIDPTDFPGSCCGCRTADRRQIKPLRNTTKPLKARNGAALLARMGIQHLRRERGPHAATNPLRSRFHRISASPIQRHAPCL